MERAQHDVQHDALHDAILWGTLEEFQRLVAVGGLPPEPTSEIRRGLLHVAAQQGRADIVEFLIRHGTAVDARDIYGASPAYRAKKYGHHGIAHMFAAHGSHPDAQRRVAYSRM